jgi:Outer membrane protein beta-barrel family
MLQAAQMNKFSNGLQMSLIAQANNTNNEGFTFQDMMDFNGSGGFSRGSGGDGGGGGGGTMSFTTTRGSGGSFGGNNIGGAPTGLRTTKAGGINFSNAFSNKFKMSSSYFVNNSYALTEKTSSRQNFAVDTTFNNVNNQNSKTKNWNTNHRLNLEMDLIIDSFNSLLIRPNVTFVQKESDINTITDILGMNKNPRSNIFQNTNSNTEQWNLSNTLLWKHKTRVKGRTLSIRLNNGFNTTKGDGDNYNEQSAFVPYNFTRIIDQINNTDNKGNTLNTRVSYTEPLSKSRIIELFYIYGRTKNDADKKTLRKDLLGKYSILDSTLSNIFENKNENQQVGFNIQTKYKKYDYAIGLGVQKANLTSINTLKNTSIIQKNIINYFPTARLNYNLGKSRRLNFNYRGNTNQPSVTQLQPVFENKNLIIT